MENNFIQPIDTAAKLDQVNRELEILYEVSNAMRTTLELDHILYIILTGVTSHEGLGFNRAVLFLYNATERCLEPKLAIGPESGEHAQRIWNYISDAKQSLDDLINVDPKEYVTKSKLFDSLKDLKIPLQPGPNNLLSEAFHKGQATHISNDHIKEYKEDIFLQHFKTNELVIMPLKAKDKVNGIIIADNLYTQKPINNHDLKIFTMLANQAGLAIENSQLYEMVRYKSHTDALTGLWNHGFFQNQLVKEIDDAQTLKTPVTLLIIDIDNFKKLNDTEGHQTGDTIMKNIAAILKESSRDVDHVCRYGGEEFAIILPQTAKDVGYAIAERIRQRIEEQSFKRPGKEADVRVTVSIGLATFPDDADGKEALITQADKAMYIAKFSGKNQSHMSNSDD